MKKRIFSLLLALVMAAALLPVAALAAALVAAPITAQAQTAVDVGRSAHEAFARYTAQAKACHTERPVNDAVMKADRDLSLKLAAVGAGFIALAAFLFRRRFQAGVRA